MAKKDKVVKFLSYTLSMLIMTFFFVEHAEAAVKIGQIGTNAGEAAKGLSVGAKQFAFFIGLVAVIGGGIGLMNAKKTQQSIGPFVVAILVGVALMSIFALIGSVSLTAFGTDESTKAVSDLGL
ncbi:hypothetical protein Q9L42_021220 (plasmid) [Methylomarinum sp. Ch1-1]|uniref:Conjugal transfer protein TrbC n=1 Tax=Methylomarinum roseum TaxID=3067653 RepID=A0AAU7P0T7_9GAMM